MDWIKSYVNKGNHPQVQAAGFWGRVVFDELCLVSGEFDLEGDLPAIYCTPRYIARRTGADSLPDGIEATEAGLAACVAAGLLEEAEGGGYLIPGWERQQPETSTKRVRRHRQAKKQEEATADEKPTRAAPRSPIAPPKQADETDETLHAFQRVPDETMKRLEETRGEESREEKKEACTSGFADANPDPPALVESKSSAPPGPKPTELQAAWNELAHPALPRWQAMTAKRRQRTKSRLAERPVDGPGGWRDVIQRISASAFCRGETGSGSWKASPDWLLRPDTAAKVLEGQYDDSGTSRPRQPPRLVGGIPHGPPVTPQNPEYQERRCRECAEYVMQRMTDDGWIPDPHKCTAAAGGTR